MFLVDPLMSSRHQSGLIEHKGVSDSQLHQLWDVFTSSSVDESLRKSAAEQLSILLQGMGVNRSTISLEFNLESFVALPFLSSAVTIMDSICLRFIVLGAEKRLRSVLKKNQRHTTNKKPIMYKDINKDNQYFCLIFRFSC